jgi:penicillin-binding protein 1A
MNRDDDPSRRPTPPLGQKPRVPVGPRRSETPAGVDADVTERDADRASPSVPATTRDRVSTGAGAGGTRSRTPSGASRRPSTTGKRTTQKPPLTRAQRIRRAILWTVLVGFVLGILGAGGLAGLFWYYGRQLPDVHRLRAQWRPPQTTRILARDGSLLAELYIERRTVVPMERIPENLVKAVLAAEDADFYRHHGLDYPGMVRALAVNIRHGTTAQGASTITQQVVKNVFLTPERTLARKVREVLLARRIEQELSKNEILYLYLNHIAFGHGRNGVEEAARFYFGKHVEQLTLGECAIIAGIPKSPTHYSPRLHPDAARTRRHWILGQMVSNRFITQAEADAADAEPIRLADPDDESQGVAPEVVEAARELLRRTAGDEALRAGGYTIQTTLDPELQREARAALQAGLRDLDGRQGYFGPLLEPGVRRVRGHAGYVLPGEPPPESGQLVPGRIYGGLVEETVEADPSQHREGGIVVRVGEVRGVVPWSSVARYVRDDLTPAAFAPRGAIVRVSVDRVATRDAQVPMRLELGPQAAMVVIDPATREVRAIVGGYDALAGMFDRASHAMRQAGSSFKPFLYSYALQSRRYTLASTIDPNPTCFDRWCPRESHPAPPNAPPQPPMRLRDALAFSRNIVAARVVMDVGPQALADHARALGITTNLQPLPALALGTSDVTPLDMTNAYATWDAGGRTQPPVLITRIVGPDGAEIALPPRAAPQQVMTAEESWLVTSLLTSVIQTPHATGTRARELHRPVAGKTGTSNESRDAWFVGYTPDLVAGVWVGFDDRQPLGRGEEGARSALPIWVTFMRRYIAMRHPPPIDFPRPPGIVTARIDPATGLLARPDQTDAMDEYFLPGTEPHEIAVPVTDAGVNWFTSSLTGGDGGIAIEAPEAMPSANPTSEPPLTLPGADAASASSDASATPTENVAPSPSNTSAPPIETAPPP